MESTHADGNNSFVSEPRATQLISVLNIIDITVRTQFKTLCKDDSSYTTQLKQRISKS